MTEFGGKLPDVTSVPLTELEEIGDTALERALKNYGTPQLWQNYSADCPDRE